jgi:DNA polymerase-3 subunit epsilon
VREVALDTETTGLDPAKGHRIIEVGCLELVNHIPTGAVFHRYVDPEMAMPADALAVHGIGDEALRGQPTFAGIVDALLAFLGDATLVIHNAEFDLGFLNMELARLGRAPLGMERAIDTVTLARRKFPGAPANLDALCKRFAIDTSERSRHGALIDARLLVRVYVELIGGKQVRLDLDPTEAARTATAARPVRPPRPHAPGAEELARHEAFVASLPDPIWSRP